MDHMDEEGSEEKENEEEETKPSSSSSTAAPSKAATKTAAKTAARASTQMTMTDIFNKNKTQMPPPSMVPFKAASLEVKQESEEKEDPTDVADSEVAGAPTVAPEVAEAVEPNVGNPVEETNTKDSEAVVAVAPDIAPEVAEAVKPNVGNPAVEKVETNVSNHSENMPTQETQEEVPKPEALEISNAVSTGTETATTEEIKKQSTVNSTGGSGCASDQIMETTETTKIEITEESQERVAWFPPGQEESQERVAWFPPGQMPEVASVINTAMRHELFERFLSCSSCTIKKEDFDLHSGVDCAEILVKLQSFNAFLEGAQKEVISLTKAELELKRATLRTYQLDCEAAAEPGDPLGDLLLKAIKHEHFLHYVEDRGWNIEEMLAWGSPDTLWEDLVDFNSFLSNSKLTVLDLEPAASSAGVDLADLGFGTLGPELPFAQPASDQVIQESQGHKVESKSKHEEEMSESESTEGDLQIGWNYPPPPTKNHPNIKCILPSATKACWMKLKR
ncbi:unnamed protein product [Durusdinium trenchii]|uniref:Uncharacterized protein n=1 Tax=Durusdinium trenchii TaxID=1381693 RepID=A0ABP0NYV3_9DINO